MRPGKDVTITAFSKMVGVSLEAAEKLAAEGIDAEVRPAAAGMIAVPLPPYSCESAHNFCLQHVERCSVCCWT